MLGKNDSDIRIEALEEPLRARHEIEEIIFEFKDKLLSKTQNPKNYSAILKTLDLLKAESIKDSFLVKGDQAPDFVLKDHQNKIFNLRSALQKSKIILTFIRGGWSPYCYLTLRGLEKYTNEFKDLNTKIIAISSEKPDCCLNTMKRNKLSFPVLSDKGNHVAQKYNLIYKSGATLNLMQELGLHAAIANGDISYEIPVPATYVIDEWMTIRFAFIDPDYRKRIPAELLLSELKKL